VDAALREKGDWIVRKLQESREREARHERARIEWRDGASFPLLGLTVRVCLDPAHRFASRGAQLGDANPSDGERLLHVALPITATEDQLRDAVQAWLMRFARGHFTKRLDAFAPLLGVRWSRLSLSNAHTRWGSAKSDGSIRLNWRLVHFSPEIVDYVVVHELSHLRVMDHSPRFWDTVGSVVPHYSTLRRQLKDEAIPRW
jgi:predicted metal-dependent hydrolase